MILSPDGNPGPPIGLLLYNDSPKSTYAHIRTHADTSKRNPFPKRKRPAKHMNAAVLAANEARRPRLAPWTLPGPTKHQNVYMTWMRTERREGSPRQSTEHRTPRCAMWCVCGDRLPPAPSTPCTLLQCRPPHAPSPNKTHARQDSGVPGVATSTRPHARTPTHTQDTELSQVLLDGLALRAAAARSPNYPSQSPHLHFVAHLAQLRQGLRHFWMPPNR